MSQRHMPVIFTLICFLPMMFSVLVIPQIMQPSHRIPHGYVEAVRDAAESEHRAKIACNVMLAVGILSIASAVAFAYLSAKKGDETALKERRLSTPFKITLGLIFLALWAVAYLTWVIRF